MTLPRLPAKGNILEAKYTPKQMKEYAARCVALEREACCKAIDEIDDGEAPEYRACQEAIRARGVNHGQD